MSDARALLDELRLNLARRAKNIRRDLAGPTHLQIYSVDTPQATDSPIVSLIEPKTRPTKQSGNTKNSELTFSPQTNSPLHYMSTVKNYLNRKTYERLYSNDTFSKTNKNYRLEREPAGPRALREEDVLQEYSLQPTNELFTFRPNTENYFIKRLNMPK